MLIDLGPDILTGAALAGRSLAGLRYCLQTHSHADHLDPSLLETRGPGWGGVGIHQLDLFASPATLQRMAEHFQGFYGADDLLDPAAQERLMLRLHPVEALLCLRRPKRP